MPLATLLKYLRLPLDTAPLLVILLFAFLIAIALGQGIFIAVPTLVILSSWFFKYSFVVLDHVIDGKHDLPALSAEMINPVEQRPLGMLLLLGGGYWATMSLAPSWNQWVLYALRTALFALVPAMIATMSITGRFRDALNPITVFGAIARMPLAYLQLVVVIALLWFVPVMFLRAFGLPGVLFVPVALFMYLWLAMCACIGGIIYENRVDLGYEPVHSPERSAERSRRELERERDGLMDPIFAECRGGSFANAGLSVRRLIEDSPRPLEEFRWLYARAATWPDQRLAEYLVQLCLPRFLEARANGEALDLVRARLRVNGEFRPTASAHLLHIAMLARDAGDRATARSLLKDFDRHYPHDVAAAMAAKLSLTLQH